MEEKLSLFPSFKESKNVYIGLGAVTVFLLLMLYTLFLAHSINMVPSDIGRHIKNGELFLTEWKIPDVNRYSYTEPEFPVINHHWGSGALFFLITKMGGLTGLHLFFIILSLATFLLFFKISLRFVTIPIASIVALFSIPLLAERTEIRPEAFSYLLVGIFLWILFRKKQYWLLPILTIFWVNLHIYFVLGAALTGAFLVEALLQKKTESKRLAIALGSVIIAAGVNPFGIQGAIAPLTIFKNYGYKLAENQSIWFMQKLTHDPNFLIFKIIFVAIIILFFAACWQRRKLPSIAILLIALGISMLTWFAIRNLALFGLVALPTAASLIAAVFPHILKKTTDWCIAALCVVGIAFIVVWGSGLERYFPFWAMRGVGVPQENARSVVFFREHNLSGPIFNNYDIGGYLIYHLYPQERTFVDNRPEAYSVPFFKERYIPMQENEEVWRKEDERYRFNVIYFSYHDATPWGQKFLATRIADPAWAPVFVDGDVLIFLRRTAANQPIISRFELPKSTFRTGNTSS
ncbi:MAG TPA: hypothetical protein VJH55_02745 [Candidatus Paceibacterota bacterium]